MSINKCENKEMEKDNSCNDNALDHSESQVITPIKIESILSSPNKENNFPNFHNISCKDDSMNSSNNNTFPLNQRELQNLSKSPIFKRREKSQCATTPQINACSPRKRTISMSNNHNTFKSELHNANDFNDFENINFVHDLDAIINCEDIKVSDILLSSIIDTNIAQETDDGLANVSKDPSTDPLFISDRERKDTDAFTSSKAESPVRKKRRSNRLYSKMAFKKHQKHIPKKLSKELENIKKWEDMPLIVIKKLQSLRVKLIHKVPPQHKIELTGAHAPTRENKKLFQRYGPLRRGNYSPTEDKTIRKNWEMFCKLHDWDSKRTETFLNWRHNGRYYIDKVKERQKFVQFIANGLPWRTLYSVYSRFKILYSNKITYTRYTSKEDKKILMYIQDKNLDKRDTKYIELAKLLKRTRRSVVKRYRYLKDINSDKSETGSLINVRWTLPLIKKFIKTLINVTISDDVKELKDAILPKPIWQKMEEKLNIQENILKTFWQHQLHMQLFSTGPIYLNDIKIQLIEYMYVKGISNTREIIWHNVARYFDGATAIFLCKVFYYLVQECDMHDTDNFADIVEYLYHTKIPEIQEASTDKFLPRIIYKNGKIHLNTEKSNGAIKTDNSDDSANDT